MANVQVIFDRIEVDKDGDPGVTDGGGEFYYTLNVNGSRVGSTSTVASEWATLANPAIVRGALAGVTRVFFGVSLGTEPLLPT